MYILLYKKYWRTYITFILFKKYPLTHSNIHTRNRFLHSFFFGDFIIFFLYFFSDLSSFFFFFWWHGLYLMITAAISLHIHHQRASIPIDSVFTSLIEIDIFMFSFYHLGQTVPTYWFSKIKLKTKFLLDAPR